MNIIEIERLIRRIHGILKGDGEAAMAPKLAEDFKTVSSGAALRLEQCRVMINAGAAPQAVQLAETAPNLLDVVTLIEFRETEAWRQYCQKHNLVVSEKLDPRAVQILNDCYSRGITPQHPVYGAYREAILSKNDEAARAALLSIARLNPSDANAAAELARLDSKILNQRLAKLEQCLGKDEKSALIEMEAIESLAFKAKPSGSVWMQGQMLRCQALVTEAENLMVESALNEVAARVDLVTNLKNEYKLEWPPDLNDRMVRLYNWCHAEFESRQVEENYRRLLGQLEEFIHTSTRKKYTSVKAMQSDLVALDGKYSWLEKFSRPISSELQQRYRECMSRLEHQISRSERKKLITMIAGATAAVLVLGIMAVALVGVQRSRSLAADLQDAVERHQVRQLLSLVKRAQSEKLIPTPQLKTALAAAQREIDSQMSPLDKFKALSGSLPASFDGISTIQEMAHLNNTFAAAEQAYAKLAPDLQQENLPSLQKFKASWGAYCSKMQPAINQQIEEDIKRQDVLANSDSSVDFSRFRQNLSAAIPGLEQLSGIISNLSSVVPVRSDLATRCASLLAQSRDAQANAEKLEQDLESLPGARDLSDYARHVVHMGQISVSPGGYSQAARQASVLVELKETPNALSRRLLTGDHGDLWNCLKQNRTTGLIPAKVGTTARQQFVELLRDYAIVAEHHRFDIFMDEQKTQHQSWITTGALRNEEGWHSIPAWNMGNGGNCEFGSLDYGYFQGKYRLSDKEPIFQIQDTYLSGQTTIWSESGFSTLINPRSMVYNLPPLRVADALCADQTSSPLVRAYLLQKLMAIMEKQPDESGLVFVPELQNLDAALRVAGADMLRSGDWFIVARVSSMQPGLEKMFGSLKAVSFEKRAAKLMDALNAAAKDGFTFSGYVKPDGLPYWLGTPKDGYVWGYQGNNEPGLLYFVHGGQARAVNKALPLTPLLLFSGDLPALMAQASISNGNGTAPKWLPPLFVSPLPQ